MKTDTEDIIKLIDEEIRWCENYDEVAIVTEDFYFGFIDGLKQAKYLIKQIENVDDDEDELDKEIYNEAYMVTMELKKKLD